eukprot:3060689-Pyramimonas_sp.AAC.1
MSSAWRWVLRGGPCETHVWIYRHGGPRARSSFVQSVRCGHCLGPRVRGLKKIPLPDHVVPSGSRAAATSWNIAPPHMV